MNLGTFFEIRGDPKVFTDQHRYLLSRYSLLEDQKSFEWVAHRLFELEKWGFWSLRKRSRPSEPVVTEKNGVPMTTCLFVFLFLDVSPTGVPVFLFNSQVRRRLLAEDPFPLPTDNPWRLRSKTCEPIHLSDRIPVECTKVKNPLLSGPLRRFVNQWS